MNLYLLTPTKVGSYDCIAAMVVVAHDEDEARGMWPKDETFPVDGCRMIGTATDEFTEQEVICTDYLEP